MAQQTEQIRQPQEKPSFSCVLYSSRAQGIFLSLLDKHLGLISAPDEKKEEKYQEFAEKMHITVEMLKGRDILPHYLPALNLARNIHDELLKKASENKYINFNRKVSGFFNNIKLVKITDGRRRFLEAKKAGSFSYIMAGIMADKKLSTEQVGMIYAKIENRINVVTGELNPYSVTSTTEHLNGEWMPLPHFLISYAKFLGLKREEVPDMFKLADIPYAALEEHLDDMEYEKQEPAPLYNDEYLEKRQEVEKYWKDHVVKTSRISEEKNMVEKTKILTEKILKAGKSSELVKAVFEYSGKTRDKFIKIEGSEEYVSENRIIHALRMKGYGVPSINEYKAMLEFVPVEMKEIFMQKATKYIEERVAILKPQSKQRLSYIEQLEKERSGNKSEGKSIA